MKLHFVFVSIFSVVILSSWNTLASSNFSVLDYGAIGNGKIDDSQAFLKAWKEVCGTSQNNSTLYAPPQKTYMLKPLQFKGPCKAKQIHFQLSGIVVAPTKGLWSNYNNDKWIEFLDINGLIVNGRGQIDGQGSSWWNKCHKNCKRPTALSFHNCNGLQLSEMKHINSAKNHMSINGCNNTIISQIHIIAPHNSPNTDGIDISHSNKVLIQNSIMEIGDDCIAINNGAFNINIVNVTCGPGHGISVGSLGKDGEYQVVENVNVRNCHFQGTENGVRIKTWEGGYGYARNITFEKITLVSVKNPVIIDQYYSPHATLTPNKAMEIKVSNVTYREINGTSANENAIILNCSQSRCTNIIMENVNIKTSSREHEAKAICQNVDGKSKSTVIPHVPCLS